MADLLTVVFSYFDTIGVFLLYSWPFFILVWILILKFIWKNWPIDVIIIEKRGNNLIKTNDRAGKYLDGYSGITGYRLQKAKDTLPVINYDWVLHNVAINTTLFDRFVNLIRGNVGTLFLFKYGAKQYKPVLIKQNGQKKFIYKLIKQNNEPVLLRIYEQFDPRKHFGALDFEIIDWDNMNFMVQEQRASFERRQKKKDFWKQIVVPLIIIACATIIFIITVKYSYDLASAYGGAKAPEQTQPATQPKIPIVSDIIPPAS